MYVVRALLPTGAELACADTRDCVLQDFGERQDLEGIDDNGQFKARFFRTGGRVGSNLNMGTCGGWVTRVTVASMC